MNLNLLLFSHLFFLGRESSNKSLECNFVYHADPKHCCGIFNANIKQNTKIHFLEPNSTKDTINCLSFSSSYIKYIPSEVNLEFQNLKEIIITNSNMTKIGINFFKNLSNLEELHMTYNEILKIEQDVFKELKILEVLKVESCAIESLPSKIFKYNKNLKKLSLNYNGLLSLDEEILENLFDLREFSAAGNQIEELPSQLFKFNKKLEEVSLAKNKILKLPENLFRNQEKLTVLILSENQLQTLPTNIFNTTKILETIRLADNQIKVFDRAVFEGLSNLKEFNMDRNNCTNTTLINDARLADWFIASRLRDCIFKNETESQTTTMRTLYISQLRNKGRKVNRN